MTYSGWKKKNVTLRGGPVVWAWDFHVGGLKLETPWQRKQGVCPFGSSSSHRACLVQDGVDTFEAPRHQNDRNEDIEMGIQRPMDSGELRLDEFLKQVQQIEKQYEKLEKLLKKLQSIGGVGVDEAFSNQVVDSSRDCLLVTKQTKNDTFIGILLSRLVFKANSPSQVRFDSTANTLTLLKGPCLVST
ncbi:hypothetical protein H5410_003617 [Solanum commersonii]|uniref:Syntaxin N-terminal domain-containing protein n=1 Tax=Solanum commersonii TaxID=4109 RepID=A0A9J6B5N4_SOLCO|nr:hypothetical protein H5410_003617 [Solanum commersonii]